MEKQEKKRVRRTSKQVEKDIMEATAQVVAEAGFAGTTLTGIAARAKVEPQVIYNRYDNLTGLLDSFATNYDYWLSDLCQRHDISDKQGYFLTTLHDLAQSLYENEVMQKLLLWELSEDNPTTRRIAAHREEMGLKLTEEYERLFSEHGINDSPAINAIVIGGIYYLILHRKRSTFGGIDFNSEEGRESLMSALKSLTSAIFSLLQRHDEMRTVAEKLRKAGVSEEIIVEATGYSR